MRILLFGGMGFIGEYLAQKLSLRNDCKIKIVGRESKVQDFDSEVVVILTQPGQALKDFLPIISSAHTIKKIVYCSTLLLYPNSQEKQDEGASLDPKTEYEKNKYEEELLLSTMTQKEKILLCIARLANVYGNIKNR